MIIKAIVESRQLSSDLDALTIYERLRTVYREDQLFLLESLGGPELDRNRSAIGFEPLMTLSVMGRVMTIDPLGSELLSGVLKSCGEVKRGVVRLPVHDAQDVFEMLRRIESSFRISGEHEGPFGLGWFGYFGYDTIFMIENLEELIPRDALLPVISLTLYRGIVNLDLKAGRQSIIVTDLEEESVAPDMKGRNGSSGRGTGDGAVCGSGLLERVLDLLQSDCSSVDQKDIPDNHFVGADCEQPGSSEGYKDASNPGGIGEDYPYSARDTIDRDLFYRWFTKGKEHIAQGDVYQLQLGHEIQVDSRIPPFQVYRRLRHQDPSPYMYYFVTPQGVHVIGASPELFIGLTPDGDITLRPIAGTVGNPGEGEARRAAIRQLTGDPKERAEHLMLVDLGRNDVARCCTPESLKVDRLMTTEVYSHVIHMVSDVVGRIRPGLDKYDVFAAAFPAGTMTGTPKVRAVEIIEETEVSPRGVYAGAVGFLGFDGMVLTALCIRTASYHSGSYHLRASAGIVEDSQPESEWQETMKKMSSAYLAITGRELAHERLAD